MALNPWDPDVLQHRRRQPRRRLDDYLRTLEERENADRPKPSDADVEALPAGA